MDGLNEVLKALQECLPTMKGFANWLSLVLALFVVLRPPLSKLVKLLFEIKSLAESYPSELKRNQQTRTTVSRNTRELREQNETLKGHVEVLDSLTSTLQDHHERLENHHLRITRLEDEDDDTQAPAAG